METITLNRRECRVARILVQEKGKVTCQDESGELWAVGLVAGTYPAKRYLELMPAGAVLVVENAQVLMDGRGRLRRVEYGPGANETGANPDFVVTAASRNAREMQIKMDRLARKTSMLDKRLAALDGLAKRRGEDLGDKVVQEPADVVDDGDTGAEAPAVDAEGETAGAEA